MSDQPRQEHQPRLDQLTLWAQAHLDKLHAHDQPEALTLEPLAGDAGARRYYRLNTEPSLLAVDSPPESEDAGHFARLSQHFLQHHIATPNVVAVDEEQGYLLVEDFGDRLLYRALRHQPDSANTVYGEALMQLLALQQTPPSELLPPYDQPRLRQELELFPEWFLAQMLQQPPSGDDRALLDATFNLLEASALEQPQVAVHRDYHSRNLLLRPDGVMGIVDFQDAVWGPITYDVVSLLRDCYIRWPAEHTRQWALGYGNLACGIGLLEDVTEAQFLRWLDLMGLHRHLKVLGVFSRLSLRDNKDGYLDHLGLAIRYIMEVASAYPELKEFRNWFERKVLPGALAQPWYQDYRVAGDARA